MCKKACGLCQGMTPAPSVTCYNTDDNCPRLAKTSCYRENIADNCRKSCGLCDGMTPVESNTCYDMDPDDCPDLAKTSCWRKHIAKSCMKSCGLCKGMRPVQSVTCYDTYTNCPTIAETSCFKSNDTCRLSCGLCEGMTPKESNTCYNDPGTDCEEFATNGGCLRKTIINLCKKACGRCGDSKPVNTCTDTYSNCRSLVPDGCTQMQVRFGCRKSCKLCS